MLDDDDTGGMHEGPPRSTHPGEQAAAGQVPAAPGEPALSEQTLGEVLAQMSATEPGPAAGSAAAISVAISAALVAKTVRLSSRQLPDAEETAHAAQSLRERAVELAQADAEGVRAMLTGQDQDASHWPRQIGQLSSDVATLAAHTHEHAKPNLRADATAAITLARAAGEMVQAILASNTEWDR